MSLTPTHLLAPSSSHRSVSRTKRAPRSLLVSGHSSRPTQLYTRLSKRMRRVGWITREIRERPTSLETPRAQDTQPPQVHECFWGDLADPMTLVLAAEHCQSAVIDFSQLPSRLWSTSATNASEQSESRPLWRGSQKWLGHMILGLFGQRGATYDVPTRHSSWRENSADSATSLNQSPLREALSIPPLTPRPHSRPLTLLAPTSLLGDLRKDLLSPEALDDYTHAGWSPRILCFDWALGDTLSALERPVALGEIDRFISDLLLKLLELKRRTPHLISDLLRDRLSGFNELPLSVIGIEDLVSAILLIHQRGRETTSYWARGDRLTWGSLTQICLYLVDELDASAVQIAHQYLTRKLNQSDTQSTHHSWWRQPTQALRSLSQYQRSPINAFLVELKELASHIRGGGAPQYITADLTSLPQHFNWTPAHTLLEDQVRHLLDTGEHSSHESSHLK